MKLSLDGIRNRDEWEAENIALPSYDAAAAAEKAKREPGWVHFGIGNIFRIFIAGIADDLLNQGLLDRGITCVETFDYDIADQIYAPFDNLGLSVILNKDGSRDLRVLGSMAETVKARYQDETSWKRLKEIFSSPTLQLVSFTITEKGYALKNTDGEYSPLILADIEQGPEHAVSAMAILTAMLLERYHRGKLPIALVSMDNCSQNGSLLRSAVLTLAAEWKQRGYTEEGFLDYLHDEKLVSFPWTMIDKITPRPSPSIADDLERLGVESMQPVVTGKRTYIAPFMNAEGPQYLVIEDSFPNGRPALEHGKGVYLTDRNTVNLTERMKVTACLNPVHSALGPIGVVWGIDLFADLLKEPDLLKMGRQVAYGEGMPVISDPKILSPVKFTDELFQDRFPNEYLGDTNLRLCTDVTQGWGVRFGETIKTYVKQKGSAECLVAVPLGIAGCLRYMLGVDDAGNSYTLAPDPLADEIHERLSDIVIGDPSSLKYQLRPILSSEQIFFINLYQAGLGEKIEDMFREMIKGPGACRNAVHKYMAVI